MRNTVFNIFIILSIIATYSAEGRSMCHAKQTTGTFLVGGFTDLPVDPSPKDVKSSIVSYEDLTKRHIDWMYLPNSWKTTIVFPTQLVQVALENGTIPVVRMMPNSTGKLPAKAPDPKYQMLRISSGEFDRQLIEYAKEVARIGKEIWIEFGAEVNGDWFPWNGRWNGVEKGPENFRNTFRHIVDLFRKHGAHNACWVYHAHAQSKPRVAWNTISSYFPGEDYVDWVFLSIYGAQVRGEDSAWISQMIVEPYKELSKIAPNTPVAVGEFGVTELADPGYKGRWIEDAFKTFSDHRYQRIAAVGYWHESTWLTEAENNLRIDSSPASLRAYRDALKKIAPSAQ